MQVKLQKIGNSFMVTIPKALKEQAKLHLGDMLNIEIAENSLLIKPAVLDKLTKAQVEGGLLQIPNFHIQKVIQEIKKRDYERER
ncbi:MAG: AbrB/MazE/SpoVT family DNA-binding domain-containing protein [bacterium]